MSHIEEGVTTFPEPKDKAYTWVRGEVREGDRFQLADGNVTCIATSDIGTTTKGPHYGLGRKPVGFVRSI